MMNEGDIFSYSRSVAFADTDMSGRAHFSAILRYVEEAEHAFFAAHSNSVVSENHGWPRVHVDCDYRAALAFGDRFEIHLHITRVGKTSLGYAFRLMKSEQLCAEGNMVIVRVETQTPA